MKLIPRDVPPRSAWSLEQAGVPPLLARLFAARGIRNAWTFAWNDRGELFSASNGPDADMPEELDFVERGKHYGFPHQFADSDEHPYPAAPPRMAAAMPKVPKSTDLVTTAFLPSVGLSNTVISILTPSGANFS